ncbi:MAG: hypothetical protein ACI8TL_000593 [Natronomonas sp.]|jgi:hypothetical protein
MRPDFDSDLVVVDCSEDIGQVDHSGSGFFAKEQSSIPQLYSSNQSDDSSMR